MVTQTRKKAPPIMPIDKYKIKECLSILEIAQRYSPKINERTKRPLIICPFHNDKNLGSCRIFTDTNTFKCEACGAHGDMLKLASGYLDIPLTDMNTLLERLVSEFNISIDSVRADYTPGYNKRTSPPERLTPEEYTELLFSDHYSIPTKFEQIEYEEGVYDYVPTSNLTIYYRTLAVKDPEFHDFVICTVSRIYWFRYAQMALFCQTQGYDLLWSVVEEKMETSKRLLKKGLVDKRLFRQELKLRNQLLNEQVCTSA